MGGSPKPPPMPTPMEQAQAQISIDNANAQRQTAERQYQEEQKIDREAQQRAATQAQIHNLYNQGQSYLNTGLANLGFNDNYGITDRYLNSLNAAKSRVPEMSNAVGDYFNYDQMFRDAQMDAQKARQTQLHNQFMGATPVGWEQQYIGSNVGRDVLEAILGGQQSDAANRFETALQRGQMSQGAFENAQRKLTDQGKAGQSQLQDMLDGILGGYRSQLGGVADQFSNRIQNYQLGQNLDLGQMTQMKQQKAGDLLGRLEGDFHRAVGNTQLFNPDALMARATAATGVSNNPLRNAFTTTDQQVDNRTTGTSGVF